MSTIEALKLNVMLGDYPNTVALTQGKIKSDQLQLNFAEAKVPHDNFKRVVKGEFDVAELAIMTFLQAIGWGRPLVALPVVVPRDVATESSPPAPPKAKGESAR